MKNQEESKHERNPNAFLLSTAAPLIIGVTVGTGGNLPLAAVDATIMFSIAAIIDKKTSLLRQNKMNRMRQPNNRIETTEVSE